MATRIGMLLRSGVRWVIRLIVGWLALCGALILLFRWVPVPFTAVMLEQALLSRSGWQHQWVPYERISDSLKLAVIASEDQRFPWHHGFDTQQMSDAWQAWREGRSLRGASTISQQTAKNLLLWTHSDWVRKGAEVPLTAMMELSWPKRRILEVYLNSAEWDDGVYGAEAAARHYFHTSAQALTTEQAIRLAAILPAPRVWSPVYPDARVQQRMHWIATQMSLMGGKSYLRTLQ